MKIKYLNNVVRRNKSHFGLQSVMIYNFRLQFFILTDFEIKKIYTSPRWFRLMRL